MERNSNFEPPRSRRFNLDYPRVSKSWLLLHEMCAFAAAQKYIFGEDDPPNGHAVIGIGFDAGVTHGLDTVIRTGRDASFSDKMDVALGAFEKRANEARFFKDLIKPNCRAMMIELLKLHHVKAAPLIKPVATQVYIRADLPHYSLSGRLDVIEEGGIIGDHKTTKSSSKTKHDVSASVEAAMYCRLFIFKYARRARGFRFWVFKKKKKPEFVLTLVEQVGANEQNLLDYRIESAISEMRSGFKTGKFRLAEEGHWKCEKSGKWCPYLYTTCPKGKNRRQT